MTPVAPSHPERFSSTPRLTAQPIEAEQQLLAMFPDAADQGGMPLRMLVTMDPPDHRTYRNLTGPYFRPRVLENLEDRVGEITTLLLDQYAGTDVELDFAADIASWHPLRMICEILGVAAEQEGLILRMTNELFGAADEELGREDPENLLPEMFEYFFNLVEEKRAQPAEDLASVLANAEIDGEPLPHVELLSYFVLVSTAGHDTTRNALSGGLAASGGSRPWAPARPDGGVLRRRLQAPPDPVDAGLMPRDQVLRVFLPSGREQGLGGSALAGRSPRVGSPWGR